MYVYDLQESTNPYNAQEIGSHSLKTHFLSF